MGHERVGVLPKSRKWRAIVASIGQTARGDADVVGIADATLTALRHRYEHMHEDAGVRASFEFLVGLANASLSSAEGQAWSDLPLDLATNPSPLQIARNLRAWVADRVESREYAEIAIRAATDAIVQWQAEERRQGQLFDAVDATLAWSRAATASGFCEVTRLFFGSFTERYLNYFLEREASTALPSIESRDQFARDLARHVEGVSRHAFETAKITQSFAAGWFNNYGRAARPSHRSLTTFLRTAFGKLREELAREARAQ